MDTMFAPPTATGHTQKPADISLALVGEAISNHNSMVHDNAQRIDDVLGRLQAAVEIIGGKAPSEIAAMPGSTADQTGPRVQQSVPPLVDHLHSLVQSGDVLSVRIDRAIDAIHEQVGRLEDRIGDDARRPTKGDVGL